MKIPFRLKKIFRLRSRYLLTLVNENSLAPVLQLSMRRSALIAIVMLIVLLSGVGWYLMFRYTPMRNLLPYRIDSSLRDDYVRLVDRVDSLRYLASINDQFARNITALMADSLPVVEPDTTSSNLYDLPLDSLMGPGTAEAQFVKQFESSARYNLSVLSPVAAEGMIFYPPISGVSLKSNSSDTDLPALNVNSSAATPVSAVYRGTVIDAYYTTTKGITVLVQHPNNFISQYSGLADAFVVRGAKVNAGQRIGISADERYPLSFMLWHDGIALDPGDYIMLPQSTPVDEQEPFVAPKRSSRR